MVNNNSNQGLNPRLGTVTGLLPGSQHAIVIGAGVVLVPAFPLVKMILLSQVINGVLLPVVLIFMIILINKRDLMQEWVREEEWKLLSSARSFLSGYGCFFL